MFVPNDVAVELEAIRRIVDLVQSKLIPAHVTLCREDEIDQLPVAELCMLLSGDRYRPVTLQFGRPEEFLGHGILLNCIQGQGEFQALREQVLGRADIGSRSPHITLAHPRNPKAPGNSLPLPVSFLPAWRSPSTASASSNSSACSLGVCCNDSF